MYVTNIARTVENCKERVGSLFSRGGGLEQALSLEQFGRYLDWAAGDRARAIELYTLNTRISESLYTPLQMLEVALRNRIHAVMTEARHEDWFHDAGFLLTASQADQLAKAVEDVREGGRREPTPGRIVAALTFSFWTAMLGKDYETLWRTTLHRIGSHPDGKGFGRKDFSGPLTPIRTLRNRIAHHEPVIAWNLPKHYGKMIELTGWLCPAAADWCDAHSRFLEVYPPEGIALHRDGDGDR